MTELPSNHRNAAFPRLPVGTDPHTNPVGNPVGTDPIFAVCEFLVGKKRRANRVDAPRG